MATPEIRSNHFGIVEAVEQLHSTPDLHEAVRLIEEFKLAPELVPPSWKHSARIWEALLPHAAVESLVAHLRAISESGVFDDPELAAMLIARLSNRAKLAALGSGALESALSEFRAIPRGHPGVEQVLAAALRAVPQDKPEAARRCA